MADKINQDVKILKERLAIAQVWGVSIASIIAYINKNIKKVDYPNVDVNVIANSPDVEAWLHATTKLLFDALMVQMKGYVIETYGTVGIEPEKLIARITDLNEKFSWTQANAGGERFNSILDKINFLMPKEKIFEFVLRTW